MNKNILYIILIVFVSCRGNLEQFDQQLLIGKWKGSETWEGFKDEVLRTSNIGGLEVEFKINGECEIIYNRYPNNVFYTPDTMSLEWFFIEGNREIYLIKNGINYYHGIDSVTYESFSTNRYNLLSLDDNNLIVEYQSIYFHNDNKYEDIFDWELKKIN